MCTEQIKIMHLTNLFEYLYIYKKKIMELFNFCIVSLNNEKFQNFFKINTIVTQNNDNES